MKYVVYYETMNKIIVDANNCNDAIVKTEKYLNELGLDYYDFHAGYVYPMQVTEMEDVFYEKVSEH